ncbi:hypothetical protein VTK56DRAFT_3501 [Thermocarpiscus australiensis]
MSQPHPHPQPKPSPTTTTTALLHHLYQDVTRLRAVASPDLILHPADRALSAPPRPPLRGIEACQAHEEALVAAAGGTLAMCVSGVVANESFGCVLGTLKAGADCDGHDGDGGGDDERKKKKRGKIEVAFCGVWRFDELGRAVEHWENVSDPVALARWLKGE